MGIINIQVLTEPEVRFDDLALHQAQARIASEEQLVVDHRNGKHLYGQMQRECPLCQS